MDSRPLRPSLLLIGCGQIARVHLDHLSRNQAFQVTALVDPDPSRMAQLAERTPDNPRCYRGLTEAVRENQFDAALICTPTDQHFNQLIELWDAGVPVLCEKPLVDTRERLQEILSLSSHRPPVMIGYQRRQSAVFQTARELLRQGTIGRLQSLSLVNTERWAQTIVGTWRDDPRQNPGGFLGDAGSHKLDMLAFLTGLRPQRVLARCQNAGWHVPVTTQAWIELEGGIAATLALTGNAHHYFEEFRLHGSGGDLIVRPGELLLAQENRIETISVSMPDSTPTAAFAAMLSGNIPNPAPPTIALAVRDLTDAILASSDQHREIAL
jgi:predicted dehydrogenase